MHFVYRVTAVAPKHAFHAKCADCTVQGTAVWMSIKTSSRVLVRVPLRLARGNILQPTTKVEPALQHVVVQYELIEKGKGGKTPEADEDQIKTHYKDERCVCLSCYHTQ